MIRTLRRILKDVASGKNIEAYVLTVIGIIMAVVTVVDNIITIEVQLAVILGTLALLVFKTTAPTQPDTDLDSVLLDRQSYGPLREFIKGAKTMWVYGPSAVNVLTNSPDIEREILARGGELRVILQDPNAQPSLDILHHQLDSFSHLLVKDIDRSKDILDTLRTRSAYKIDYRLLPYSPGFSVVILDPDGREGRLVIEFFGYASASIGDRMHIEIHRQQSNYWFEYWAAQFQNMWNDARDPRPEAPASE
ncbi:MAG: hypothetical protein OHK0046_45130 [Anaerolineae bacterium]